MAAQVNSREIHGVALHEVLCLDGGQHGINPAKLAVALCLHRSGLQHHVNMESLWWGVTIFAIMLVALGEA